MRVYVNEHGYDDLISSIPRALLTYFASSLSQLQEAPKDEVQIVVLQNTNKSEATWILNWMCMGGKEIPQILAISSNETAADGILRRLRIVSYLGIKGKLYSHLIEELEYLLCESPAAFSEFIYSAYTSPSTTAELRATIASTVINCVLSWDMVVSGFCLDKHIEALAEFRLDLIKELASSPVIGRIRGIQKTDPLSVNQIHFIHMFSIDGSYIRRSVAKDLFGLIKDWPVKDQVAYSEYAKTNPEFMAHMRTASAKNKEYIQFLKRQAKRATVVHEKAQPQPRQAKEKVAGKPKPQHVKEKAAEKPKLLSAPQEFYLIPFAKLNQATRKLATKNAAAAKALPQSTPAYSIKPHTTIHTPSPPSNGKASTEQKAKTVKSTEKTTATECKPAPSIAAAPSTSSKQQLKREKRARQKAAKLAAIAAGPNTKVDKNNVYGNLEEDVAC